MISDLSRFPSVLSIIGSRAITFCMSARRIDRVTDGSGPVGANVLVEAGRNSCRQFCNARGQQPTGTAEIGCSENDAGADDANTLSRSHG